MAWFAKRAAASSAARTKRTKALAASLDLVEVQVVGHDPHPGDLWLVFRSDGLIVPEAIRAQLATRETNDLASILTRGEVDAVKLKPLASDPADRPVPASRHHDSRRLRARADTGLGGQGVFAAGVGRPSVNRNRGGCGEPLSEMAARQIRDDSPLTATRSAAQQLGRPMRGHAKQRPALSSINKQPDICIGAVNQIVPKRLATAQTPCTPVCTPRTPQSQTG